ncbi:IS110 family RNA-guided transposase [Alcanivorax sediminis]|uniref:IS110 family transposase n=1 Tax=Alcanivorax sediminis TaxID=2663008 RepID=A0A6N7LS59_9GAMM|nr:IS110 family transposase [Alcanivorax sediminis]MQX53042.1 IS110 family transposase [Alcanivorax sediminis]
MNEQAVGVDVSKKKLDICVATGNKFKSKVFANSPGGHEALNTWLQQRDIPVDTPVVLEATGPYSEAVAIFLADLGWSISVVNPSRISGYAQSELSRNKTDKADARLIACFAQRARLESWSPPSLAVRELRALVDRLQALIDMRQQELNRLEDLSQTSTSSVEKMVKEHVDWLNDQIKKIQSDIDDHIDGSPELKNDADLMQSIPGIGRRASSQMLAYIGDVRRFKNAKALAAFIGVTPRQRQSGSSINKRSAMSRTGHVAARKSLYMPGLVAKHHNPVVVAMAVRLQTRGLSPKAIVGASMRKLVHLIYGVIKSGIPFNAEISMNRLDLQEGI